MTRTPWVGGLRHVRGSASSRFLTLLLESLSGGAFLLGALHFPIPHAHGMSPPSIVEELEFIPCVGAGGSCFGDGTH